MLVESLRTHPEIWCYHEMFRRRIPSTDSFRAYLEALPYGQVRRYVRPYATTRDYLMQLITSRPERHAVGFKLMYNQLRRNPVLYLAFERMEFRVIHLLRRNILKTEVSATVAKQTGRFHLKERPEEPVRVHFDPDQLVRRLEWRERAIRRHRRRLRRFSPLEVTYEDLVADRPAQSLRITRFLGVEPRTLTTEWVKVNPDRLATIIENYDEVAERLRDTPFAELLDA